MPLTPEDQVEMKRKIDDVHRALFVAPAGGGQPLINDLVALNRAYQTGSAVTRWAIRAVITLGALAGAVTTMSILWGRIGGPQ